MSLISNGAIQDAMKTSLAVMKAAGTKFPESNLIINHNMMFNAQLEF